MKKSYYIKNAISYSVVAFIVYYFASYCCRQIGNILKSVLSDGGVNYPIGLFNTLHLLLIIPAALIFTWTMFFYLLRLTIPPIYFELENGRKWYSVAFVCIMPAEIIRLIYGLTDMGNLIGSARFSFVPTKLFDTLWCNMTNRGAVRQHENYIFTDYIGYTLCYVIWEIVCLTVVFFIFKYYWNIGEARKDDKSLKNSFFK
ncbi:MAG: hypothetical protein IJW79_04505 [Clostridia bacterium]|nr:hypothetical protein [Clostridia bacterium]